MNECAHKFEPRSIWKTVIPIPELLKIVQGDKLTARGDTADIIRACTWHCYSHDICVNCGTLVYPLTQKEAPLPTILRAVKVEQ